jgi:hypothetical protein
MNLDLDLDVRNYELRDILNLFNMPSVFTESHMREAKMTVMRTHPDKSGLDKAYFLFFSKAYKILHEVYQVRAGLSRQKDAKYDDVKEDIDARRNANSDKLKRMNADEFNRWFNQTFEQNKLCDEEQDSGYGDWLKSNDFDNANNDDDNPNEELGEGSTWAQRMEQLDRRKKKLREQALVVRGEVQSFYSFSSAGYGLTRERPEEHSSGLSIGAFGSSGLAYEDLKKAHTESVIPVTHEDYEAVRKYKNMNELQMARDVDRRTFSYSETESLMARSQQLQAEDDMRRAFKLAQQDEIVRDINAKWMAHFNAIEN